MPETTSPARGSRNFTPRIEPPDCDPSTDSYISNNWHNNEKSNLFKIPNNTVSRDVQSLDT